MGLFYQLVFSNTNWFRIARHMLFWFIWISYYAFVKAYQMVELDRMHLITALPIAWLEVLIQIPVDITFFYLVLYVLLPGLFLKGRYVSFILLWLLFLVAAALIQHVYYFWAIPDFRIAYGLRVPTDGGSVFPGALWIIGTLNAEGGFAAAIRLGKLFFIKEKESELLQKELRRVKPASPAEEEVFRPTFLYNVLNRLYSLAEKEKIDPAIVIRKLNNLIIYCGYDAKKTMLPLATELEALKEYIDLEKLSYHQELDLAFEVSGNPAGKLIIPYLLIPLVENAFSTLGAADDTASLSIDVVIQNQHLEVTITSSKSADTSTLLGGKNVNVLNIEKRLQLRYPGGYSLKKTIEPHRLLLFLEIDLSKRLWI
jgi:two-component system, LytTR family, sensor kinase